MYSRVIIFSGKGGTGKTTISAATAAQLAEQGKKVLIISTDPAHSLGDVVCRRIDRTRPTELAPNLYALEIDTLYEARQSLSGLQDYMENSYRKQGVSGPAAAELADQPGLDEIVSMNRLMEEAQSRRWDVVIVDTAPTGNTLRLLAYPELIVGGTTGATMVKAYKGIFKVVKSISKEESANERYFNQVNRLIEIMRQLNHFLLSNAVTIRLVLNAEKLSVEETKRAYTFLSLYGINLDGVIVNKLYPHGAEDAAALLGLPGQSQNQQATAPGPYFDKWVSLQNHHFHDIENSFAPLPLFKSYLQRNEPLGVEQLAQLGALVYGLVDPAARLNYQRTVWVEDVKTNGPVRRNLCLRLPFVEESDQPVQLERVGEEVVVNFGRVQRKINLPRILNQAEYIGSSYQAGILKLSFGPVLPVKVGATVLSTAASNYDDDPFKVD